MILSRRSQGGPNTHCYGFQRPITVPAKPDDAIVSCGLAAMFVLTVEVGLKAVEVPPGAAQRGCAVVVLRSVVVAVAGGEGLTAVTAHTVSCHSVVVVLTSEDMLLCVLLLCVCVFVCVRERERESVAESKSTRS